MRAASCRPRRYRFGCLPGGASAEIGHGFQDGRPGHVIDETEGADLGSEDKGYTPVFGFLVSAQRFDHALGRLAHTAHGQAQSVEGRELTRAQARCGQAETFGDAGFGGDAEGDGLAVSEATIPGDGLDGVADRVTIVEDVPELGFLLVTLDHGGLEAARARDDALERGGFPRPQGGGGALHVGEVGGVEHDAVLDDLGHPRAILALREGEEHGGVRDDEARLVEGSDQVLGAGVIDGRLPADGRVHLSEERRGHLDEIDAAHVRGRREARQIADRAASQRHHRGAAVETGLEKAVPGRSGHLERLGPLALGQQHRSDIESRLGKAPRHRSAVKRQDSRIGDEGDLAADLETGELGSDARENTGADKNPVRARAEADGDVDHGRAEGTLPALQVVEVALIVSPDLLDAVARELLEEGLGQHQRHHGLAHHSRGGHRADVAAFDHGFHRLLGRHIHGAEGLAQRRDRLHGGPHDDGLAVGHPALEAARAIGAPVEAAGGVEQDLVVDLGAGSSRGLEAHADLGAFDGVNGAEGSGEPAVELAVPLHIRAQADGAVEGHHLEDATQRIAGRLRLIDGLDHGALGRGVSAADFGCFRARPDLVPRYFQRSDAHAADLRHVTQDGDAELTQDALGHSGHGHARRGLACARALEDIADIAMPVLHGPGQVRMPRARPRHRLGRRPRRRLVHGHGVLPVLPVPVLYGEGDGTAERHTPADAGGDMGLVPLDFHAPAAAVATLPAPKVLVELLFGQRKTGGHTVYDGSEGLAVGLAGCEEAKCHTGPYYRGATGVKPMPAPPCPMTRDGVTKTTSSRPVSLFSFCLKSQPMTGISPKIGTLRTFAVANPWVTPPMTRRSPSLIRTWVSALRLLMMGTLMPTPSATLSPRELFSTRTTILILVTIFGPICSRTTVGRTSSLSTASLNWIWVPAELTVA